MLWHIGNTTVRTPYRLAEALRALLGSTLNGNLSGSTQEQAFAAFLHHNQIADVPRIEEGGNAADLGRKWRSALSQLGFITPQLTRGTQSGTIDENLVPLVVDLEELSGRPFEVTPNGKRLAAGESIVQQQECFLRSLVSYQIPSILEPRYGCAPFSPLNFVLAIIHELKENNEQARISFEEFALHVQTASPDLGVKAVTAALMAYRKDRKVAAGKVRKFDREHYDAIAEQVGRKAATLDDYADVNFRYLKATGLFSSVGRGIVVTPLKQQLADLIRVNSNIVSDEKTYLQSLWQGAALPTDDPENAITVLLDLTSRLEAADEKVEPIDISIDIADLQIERLKLEERLQRLDEQTYAKAQAGQIEEILLWMDVVSKRKVATMPDGTILSIPKSEYPAYLEWIVWRAFLAMNSLVREPWDCRNFEIDQDFLPVHCASAGKPDMVFEFENTVVVVEVTLTASSRQEAAEGEPVRRHVAAYAEQFLNQPHKRVYGLFIALSIDSNTAHTFRAGEWYLRDDSKIMLDIVPMMLAEFQKLLRHGAKDLDSMPERLAQILLSCRSFANQDAPEWKKRITHVIDKNCES